MKRFDRRCPYCGFMIDGIAPSGALLAGVKDIGLEGYPPSTDPNSDYELICPNCTEVAEVSYLLKTTLGSTFPEVVDCELTVKKVAPPAPLKLAPEEGLWVIEGSSGAYEDHVTWPSAVVFGTKEEAEEVVGLFNEAAQELTYGEMLKFDINLEWREADPPVYHAVSVSNYTGFTLPQGEEQ